MAKLTHSGGKNYLKVDNIDTTFEQTIESAYNQQGKFGMQLLIDTEDWKINVNQSSFEKLTEAFTDDSDNWIGRKVQVSEGSYTTQQGETRAMVVLTPVGDALDPIQSEEMPFGDNEEQAEELDL